MIMNEIIVDDSLRLNKVCSKSDKLWMEDKYGFSETDKKFISEQSIKFESFQWETNLLKSYAPRKKDYVLVEVDDSCNDDSRKHRFRTHLSFPLISADRKYVVFLNDEDCNCMLGGQGGTTSYIKINGHWKKDKTFDAWISEKRRNHFYNKTLAKN